MNNTPIFIGGLMKSGTSLVRKLLSLHSNIFGGLETHWFTDEFKKGWYDTSQTRSKWLSEFYELSTEEYEHLASNTGNHRAFLNALLGYCANREGKNRFVEKTPDNILHLKEIWEYWPSAKFIHVIRDVKDVYTSWKINNKGDLNSFVTQANLIHSYVTNTTLRSNNYLEIRYEDLVNNPTKELRALSIFLNEPFEDSMADYQGDCADFEKVKRITGKISPTTFNLGKPIFRSSINQWKDHMNEEEIIELNTSLKDYIARFYHERL